MCVPQLTYTAPLFRECEVEERFNSMLYGKQIVYLKNHHLKEFSISRMKAWDKVIDGLAICGLQTSYCYQGFNQLHHHDVNFNNSNNGIDYETIDNLLNCNSHNGL